MDSDSGSVVSLSSVIDASSPLFLHSSDSPNAILTPHILVDSSNYLVWSNSLYNSLLAKNKHGFLDGTCRIDQFEEHLRFQWKRCNALVLSWIASSVHKELLSNTAYMQDAHSVWCDLRERFDRVNGTKICFLYNDLYSLHQGSSSMAEYYTKLKNIWEELATMVPKLPVMEELKEYAHHLQEQKLYKFLLGLNASYANARSQILLMTPLPSLSQAYAMIVEEEQRHSVSSLGTSASSTINNGEQAAFMGNRNQNVGGKNRRDYSIICDYCHRAGHKKAQCYKLMGYPANFKFNRRPPITANTAIQQTTNLEQEKVSENSEQSGSVFTENQYKELYSMFNKGKQAIAADHITSMAGSVQWGNQTNW